MALHALLFIPLALGGAAAGSPTSDILAAQSGPGPEDGNDAMRAEILDAEADADASDPEIYGASAYPTFAPSLRPVSLPAPPPPAYAIDDAGEEQRVTRDEHGRGELFGRYIAQISARIERAWMRPRTPIGSPLFKCHVEIKQDHGVVKEVTLLRCNGDFRWQTSLVKGIQTASPLPAPPDPGVYQDRLVLDFTGVNFSAGMSPEGFEPPSFNTASR